MQLLGRRRPLQHSNIRRKRKVAAALRKYDRSMDSWVRFSMGISKLHAHQVNCFLLGVLFDRNVDAGQAWETGRRICKALESPDDDWAVWKTLRDMEAKRLRGFLRFGNGGKSFHRHYRTYARMLPQSAEHLLNEYGGDPRRIWNGIRDVEQVRRRLEAIPGIGPALSRMAVLILARNYGLLGGRKACKQLEPKPDIHVRRVFLRTGLVERKAAFDDIVAVAQLLAPDFPASLDAPAWQIGAAWCRPRKASCA